jgi:hypothetical protein
MLIWDALSDRNVKTQQQTNNNKSRAPWWTGDRAAAQLLLRRNLEADHSGTGEVWWQVQRRPRRRPEAEDPQPWLQPLVAPSGGHPSWLSPPALSAEATSWVDSRSWDIASVLCGNTLSAGDGMHSSYHFAQDEWVATDRQAAGRMPVEDELVGNGVGERAWGAEDQERSEDVDLPTMPPLGRPAWEAPAMQTESEGLTSRTPAAVNGVFRHQPNQGVSSTPEEWGFGGRHTSAAGDPCEFSPSYEESESGVCTPAEPVKVSAADSAADSANTSGCGEGWPQESDMIGALIATPEQESSERLLLTTRVEMGAVGPIGRGMSDLKLQAAQPAAGGAMEAGAGVTGTTTPSRPAAVAPAAAAFEECGAGESAFSAPVARAVDRAVGKADGRSAGAEPGRAEDGAPVVTTDQDKAGPCSSDAGDTHALGEHVPRRGAQAAAVEESLVELACSRINTSNPVTAARLFWTLGSFRKPVDNDAAVAVAATAARTVPLMHARNVANSVWGLAWLQVAQKEQGGREVADGKMLSMLAECAAQWLPPARPWSSHLASSPSPERAGVSANGAATEDARQPSGSVALAEPSNRGRFSPPEYAMMLSGFARLQAPLTAEQDSALVSAAEAYLPRCGPSEVGAVAWALSKRQVCIAGLLW